MEVHPKMTTTRRFRAILWILGSMLIRFGSSAPFSLTAAATATAPPPQDRPSSLATSPRTSRRRSWARHPDRMTMTMIIRGGAVPTPSFSTNDTSSVAFQLRAAAGSVSLVTTELVRQHVLPVLQQPYHKVWVPMVRFLQAQEDAAVERRLQQKQLQYVAATTVAQAPATTILEESSSSFPPPPPPPPKTAAVRVAADNKSSQQGVARSSLCRALLPTRLFRLSLTAWILAEGLDRLGVLHPDMPAVLRSQFHRVWYDLQPHWTQWQRRIVSAWRRVAPRGLKSTPTKYQFAVGAGVGMIVSPVLLPWTMALWQPALALYGLAEWNARSKLLLQTHHPWALHVDQGLESVRQAMTGLVLPPVSTDRVSYPQTRMLATSGGSKKATYKLGISSSSSSALTPETTTPSPRSHTLVTASSNNNSRSHLMKDHVPDWEHRQLVEMIRHGFWVGGVVGLLGGL